MRRTLHDFGLFRLNSHNYNGLRVRKYCGPAGPPNDPCDMMIYTHTSIEVQSRLVQQSESKTRPLNLNVSKIQDHTYRSYLTSYSSLPVVEDILRAQLEVSQRYIESTIIFVWHNN